MALLAVAGGQPHGFYHEVRWVIFSVCCLGVFQNIDNTKKWVLMGFIVIGVIFNPFIPLRFKKDIWHLIDILSSVSLIIFCFNMKKNL